MPSSDYTAAGGGLKLKGGSGIDKKKKKKKPKPTTDVSADNPTPTDTTQPSSSDPQTGKASLSKRTNSRSISPEEAEKEIRKTGGRQKTEAEKRHEETRRKRLDERLKRDGVKTHKEKVEELNRYLSGLSEHHDMPKIGPG